MALLKNENVELLKLKLKSLTKLKLSTEREVLKLRNYERSLIEEQIMLNDEIEQLKTQLQDMKNTISESHYQISMIEICKTSEKVKIQAHIESLLSHKQGYENMFRKEKQTTDLQKKEMLERVAENSESNNLKQIEIANINSKQLKEAIDLEERSVVLERECAVLKKRNAAIMLKLRRKLVETEDIRKGLLKKNIEEK